MKKRFTELSLDPLQDFVKIPKWVDSSCKEVEDKNYEPYFLLLTEAVQVIALFTKELVTSCESLSDFLTVNDFTTKATQLKYYFSD